MSWTRAPSGRLYRTATGRRATTCPETYEPGDACEHWVGVTPLNVTMTYTAVGAPGFGCTGGILNTSYVCIQGPCAGLGTSPCCFAASIACGPLVIYSALRIQSSTLIRVTLGNAIGTGDYFFYEDVPPAGFFTGGGTVNNSLGAGTCTILLGP